MALTHKQQAFAIQYCVDFNATQAAIRAGYSPDSAGAEGSRLLTNAEIQKCIEETKERAARVALLTPEYVLDKWREIIEEDPNELMEGQLKPCSQCWPDPNFRFDEPDPRCQLCGGEGHLVTIFKNTRGRKIFAGIKKTDKGIEYKTIDKAKILENLASYLGMNKRVAEISGPGGKAIPVIDLQVNAHDLPDDVLAAIATGRLQGVVELPAMT